MNVCLSGLDVHSIQNYLGASGKLREMVGASGLVDYFTRIRPLQILEGMGLSPCEAPKSTADWFVPIRVIGGVVRVLLPGRGHGVEWAKQLTAEILEQAPGLHVGVAHEEFEWEQCAIGDVLEELIQRIERKRHRPVAGAEFRGVPMTALCKLTGDPAAGYGEDVGERLSVECLRKREFYARARRSPDRLLKRLLADEKFGQELRRYGPDNDIEFAVDFKHLGPSDWRETGSAYMAVARFDGNRIGQVIAERFQRGSSNDEQVPGFARFCRRLDEATLTAFGEAGSATLVKALRAGGEGDLAFHKDGKTAHLPIRPLVCGGDDFTVVLRGDLGLGFALRFLRAFERSTEHILGDTLTAAAGIALVPTHYPFVRAYAIADGLLRSAKERDRERSIIDFQVVQGEVPTDIRRIRETEYTAADGCSLTHRPLDLQEMNGFLKQAVDIRDRLPRRHVKRAVDLCRVGQDPAQQAYIMLRANLERSVGGRHAETLMAPKVFDGYYKEGFFSGGKTDLLDCVEVFDFVGPDAARGLG